MGGREIARQGESITVAQHCLIIALLGLLDSYRDFIRGYGMDFVGYSYLVLLISRQMLQNTVVLEKIWELNGA